MGCGKMKAGGPVKKVKKMALGGSATNKLNNPRPATKPKMGGGGTKLGIYGVPQEGPTGPNIQGINTMKKGGAMKRKGGLVKALKGISTSSSYGGYNTKEARDKDNWGRPTNSKWYGFNPDTKKYTTGKYKGKTYTQKKEIDEQAKKKIDEQAKETARHTRYYTLKRIIRAFKNM